MSPRYPWPAESVCIVDLDELERTGYSWITWRDPEGWRTGLPITTGPHGTRDGHPTWHAEIDRARGEIVTSPSIRVQKPEGGALVEIYHSPVSVRWKVVDEIEGPVYVAPL